MPSYYSRFFGCDSDSDEDIRSEFSLCRRPARRCCPECGQFASHHPNCPDCESEEPQDETETEMD